MSAQTPSNNKKRNIIVGSVAGVIIVIIAAIIIFMMATRVGSLSVQVNAEGWNKDTSTPVEMALYQGDVKAALEDDDQNNDPDALTTVVMDANTAWGIDEVTDKGTYTIEVLATPILENGTLFKVPEIQVANLAGDDVVATFDLEKLDLANASAEEVEAATEAAEKAAQESGNEAAVAAASTATKAATSKAPATSSGSNGSSYTPSSGTSSSGGGSSSSSTQPSQPAHQHSWVPQYIKVQVGSVTICDTCGAKNPTHEHMKNHAKADEGSGNTHVEPIYEDKLSYYYCPGCGATK